MLLMTTDEIQAEIDHMQRDPVRRGMVRTWPASYPKQWLDEHVAGDITLRPEERDACAWLVQQEHRAKLGKAPTRG